MVDSKLRFAYKTKRPRLSLSLGTSVDQPSPKCCSRTTLNVTPNPVNGSPVPYMARKWWAATNQRKRSKEIRQTDRTFEVHVPRTRPGGSRCGSRSQLLRTGSHRLLHSNLHRP